MSASQDDDNSGKLSAGEILSLIHVKDATLSRKQARSMIEKMTSFVDVNWGITYEEWAERDSNRIEKNRIDVSAKKGSHNSVPAPKGASDLT